MSSTQRVLGACAIAVAVSFGSVFGTGVAVAQTGDSSSGSSVVRDAGTSSDTTGDTRADGKGETVVRTGVDGSPNGAVTADERGAPVPPKRSRGAAQLFRDIGRLFGNLFVDRTTPRPTSPAPASPQIVGPVPDEVPQSVPKFVTITPFESTPPASKRDDAAVFDPVPND